MLSSLHRSLVILGFCLAFTTVAPPSHAEDPAIETNYSAGKAALKGGKLDDALGHFKTALALSKDDEGRTWQMLLAIALTYKERAEPHHAIEYYRRFLKQTEADQDMMQVKWKKRREMAKRDLAEVERLSESTHGFVPVKSTPAGAKILVDGMQGGADGDAVTPFGLSLPAGVHSIRITLKGYKPFERTITVRAGGAHPIKATLEFDVPTAAPTAAPEPAPVTPIMPSAGADLSATAQPPEGDSPIGAWLTLGAAGALGIAGVAMSVLASEAQKELDDIENNTGDALKLGASASNADNLAEGQALSAQWDTAAADRDSYQLIGGVLYGVALAATATGVIWLLVAEPDTPAPDAAFGLSPTAGGAYGHATWRF